MNTHKIHLLFSKIISIILFFSLNILPQPTIRFAVIGDFGDAGSHEEDVANLLDSWNVDFIITVGDNNYPDG